MLSFFITTGPFYKFGTLLVLIQADYNLLWLCTKARLSAGLFFILADKKAPQLSKLVLIFAPKF